MIWGCENGGVGEAGNVGDGGRQSVFGDVRDEREVSAIETSLDGDPVPLSKTRRLIASCKTLQRSDVLNVNALDTTRPVYPSYASTGIRDDCV